jgi:hypothetical protein
MSGASRFSVTDPATAADRGWSAPLNPGSANLRAALTHGQEIIIAPVTAAGLTAMTFPGAAVGEAPAGGAAGFLRWKNTDICAIRVRRIYMTVSDAGAVSGAFMLRIRIGASYLHTGYIHSGTVRGNVVPFNLGEGFIALPGDTVTVETFAQVAVPAAFTVRQTWSGIRIVNWKNEPVPTDPGAEGRLLKSLHQAIESADSRAALAILNEEQLTRRWWAFVNGEGGLSDGVGADQAVYGFGGVDLATATGPVTTGFQNQQTGPFLLEALMFFDDGADPDADGFQVNQIQLSNTNYISDGGGPLRSDVLRAISFPGGNLSDRLLIPYVLDVPIWITPNRPLRVTLDQAVGLNPVTVWVTYLGTLFGNPQK